MFAGRCLFLCVVFAVVLLSRSAVAELTFSAEASVIRSSYGKRGFAALLTLKLPLPRAGSRAGVLAQPEVEPVARPRLKPAVRLDPRFVRRVVLAAHRAGRRPQALARLSSLASRSRTSGALPEVSLRAERSVDESLRLAPTINDPYRYTQAGGVRTVVGGKLTWRLNRLVFASDELAVERLRLERARLDAKRVKRVIAQLFRWQRAKNQERSADLAMEDRVAAALTALEAELLLDVLTGGWFSAAIAKRRR